MRTHYRISRDEMIVLIVITSFAHYDLFDTMIIMFSSSLLSSLESVARRMERSGSRSSLLSAVSAEISIPKTDPRFLFLPSDSSSVDADSSINDDDDDNDGGDIEAGITIAATCFWISLLSSSASTSWTAGIVGNIVMSSAFSIIADSVMSSKTDAG